MLNFTSVLSRKRPKIAIPGVQKRAIIPAKSRLLGLSDGRDICDLNRATLAIRNFEIDQPKSVSRPTGPDARPGTPPPILQG